MTDMPNTSQSQQWFERSSKVIPGGVNSPVRAFGSVGGQARVIERGAGYERQRAIYQRTGDWKDVVDATCAEMWELSL